MTDNEFKLVDVQDLRAGDVVDLAGDPYAQCGDEDHGEPDHAVHCLFTYESARIGDDYDNPGEFVADNTWAVYGNFGSFNVPRYHRLKRVGHVD